MTFEALFQTATGNLPYDYQRRLAESSCESCLINIPTGLGKTAAVVLAWLWNRVRHPDEAHRSKWPRRLVYCLPMRTLVEQTRDEAKKWLQAHELLWDEKESHEGKVGLHILMGGEDAGEWDIHPEREAILIGTQDMLLSRALNRGYGMSRYRWPMHFGLLNNDCLWVMDETQLMGVGLETSGQLDGFRAAADWRPIGTCRTWWMSATLDPSRLATVDHPIPIGGWPVVNLSKKELTEGRAHDLVEAKKAISPCPLVLNADTKGTYAKELAALIHAGHQHGTLTLVVVNRVRRAREIYEALVGGKVPQRPRQDTALIHSRFRPVDRTRHTALLFGEGDRIVIATQAVEAGVDVSARLLITELSPWSSLLQRMGRCNRQARIQDAQVLWVDIQPKDEKDDLLLPYTKDELVNARAAVNTITEACPRSLGAINVPEAPVVRPVIRRRDLVDLFDTTPDICGQDLDVSRYIRDGEDSDVQFFWRAIEGAIPTDNEPPPHRDELCRVSIGEAAKFLTKADAWTWNPLDQKWEDAKRPRPGAVYLVTVASGGYHDDLGWTGDPKHKPTPHLPLAAVNESYDGNRLTFICQWQTLAVHTQKVADATEELTAAVALGTGITTALRTAAIWHDVGKAHVEFQSMLHNGVPTRGEQIWAKSATLGGKCRRAGFRHELASCLAWLLAGPQDALERDLIAYLIAAHHGKVRLSIRSLPNEPAPSDDRLFARGIWQGDTLPPIPGLTTIPVTLDLSFMRMGTGEHGKSWLARTIAVRDQFGPFRLAYFEMILRAADARASALEMQP